MSALAKPQKIAYISFAQVVSMFAVVALHTNGCFWQFSPELYWFSANIIECVFYFAVPVFFMITGITLINFPERYSLKQYFSKRIVKTLIPFLVWSMIGLAYHLYFGNIQGSELSLISVIDKTLSTKIVSIYWFFPTLFCIYLGLPLLAAVPKDKRNSIFLYLLLAGFTVNTLIPFVIKVLGLSISWPISLGMAGGHFIFVIGGVLLHENPLKRRHRFILYFAGIAALLAHIIGTYVLSIEAGTIVQTYKGYTNVPSIVFSFAVFVFLREVGTWIMSTGLKRFFDIVAGYSFPVYLMHWYIMDLIKRIFNPDILSLLYRLGAPFVIILVVILITWLLRKIPIVRRIVP